MNRILKIQLLSLTLLFAVQSIAFAQQNITVVKLNNGGRYIETQNGTVGMGKSYYVGPSATQVLIQSMKKAIEWHDLNQSHRMSFTKEVNRFKVMDKPTYEFHGYVSQFADNAKVIFEGYSNGRSICKVIIESKAGGFSPDFLSLSGRDAMESFLNILQGKSARPEIDNIFKN